MTSRSFATSWTRRQRASAALARGVRHARYSGRRVHQLSSIASGTVAHVELSWLAPSKLRRTTIVGSRKMIVYDDTIRRTGPRV